MFHFPSGDRYDGEWANGKMSGTGQYFYGAGEYYEGQWNKDHKDGDGIYHFDDGKIQASKRAPLL